ncbi:hypothetical protein NQ317_008107, partial [Molorchus minor]
EAANTACLNLLSDKFRQIYLKQYESFMEWCKTRKAKNLNEEVFLVYFLEKAKSFKSSTLWSIYSMLKSTVMVKNNIEISKFPKLIAFFKKQNVGDQAKKSAVFTRSDLSRFLTEAPDQDYLMWKLIICYSLGVLDNLIGWSL